MSFKDEKTRILFFRYALPCAETLAKRGVITQKLKTRLMRNVLFNEKIPENSEKIFKIALLMCERTAKSLGKKFIDKDVVRKYFLFGHDEVVDKRYKIFKDFDPIECRLYVGKIIRLKNRDAVILTIFGKKRYNTGISPNLKIGDYVAVHRNFVIEKITASLAKNLWVLK